MIKVIGGAFKGRRLRLVRSPLVRPMPAKLREALFNILKEKVKDAVVLDGFAGTGAVGIEALSRGAARAVFVEEYYPAVKTIKENLARCEAEDRARVIHKEFNRAVIQLAGEKAAFDLIFLDPPYKLLEERNPLKVIKKRNILKPRGLIVLRHFFKTAPAQKHFELKRTITIGDDTLSFLS
ncbi:MAG: 16S rRNA (guanine(966)-N(2))-methyltransferase RsmD [Clostridiales bacterium]|nr:16S rRNA (guanine(966)-N(2))-methyltransferase RsmD [Clostridiales bacterium]